MKVSQRVIVLVEGLFYVALAYFIQSAFPDVLSPWHIAVRIGYTLLIYYSFRRGALAGVLMGIVLGTLSCLGLNQPGVQIPQLVGIVIASGLLGMAGLFARNLQRTLYNHKMGPAYLNLVTGTIISWMAYFMCRFVINTFFVHQTEIRTYGVWQENLTSFFANTVISLLILIVMMNISSKNFIPKSTPYISRRERSRLLNDD